jgi:nickel-dependent lactate racemase
MEQINVNIPSWEWYGWKHEAISFPRTWSIKVQKMEGHNSKKLTSEDITEKLNHPIGAETLRDLSKGKNKCCIIFDDMTRPTKISQLIPYVLTELYEGGLTKDQIIFVMATGAHGGRNLIGFQKKLGFKIPEEFLVFPHNAYENLVYLGETGYGTPIHINREVMSCDLKIAIGSIMPHFGFGFGGGSKIILPGIAGIETISPNHRIRDGTGTGNVAANKRRLDSEEASRMVELDFVLNVLLNSNCDVANLVCGDFVDAHRIGVDVARKHYRTEVAKNVDISVGNGYPMANEGYKAYRIIEESVREKGDIVFLLYTPEGCRLHYYNGRFGRDYGGQGWTPEVYVKKPWKMNRIICVTPQKNKMDELYYGEGSQWVKNWSQSLKMLKEVHGEEANVAVYPTASMQISRKNADNK